MAGLARADLCVGRVRRLPAHVPGLDRRHPLQIVEHGLQAPETSSGEGRDLPLPLSVISLRLFSRWRANLSRLRPTSLQYAAWATSQVKTPSADSANQPPPLVGFNAWSGDRILRDAVEREGGGWIAARAKPDGRARRQRAHADARGASEPHAPELRTHDRFGNRIDSVEYHPAYHELMALAFGAGLHSLAWTENRPGAWVARARRSTISGIRARTASPAR